MFITFDSTLTLVPIEIRKDKKHYIVEDKFSGEFYEMSEVGIDALQFIQKGKQLGVIEHILKDRFPNEEVDIIDFAEQLYELGLIDEIDGVKGEKSRQPSPALGFYWISPKVGKIFFNQFTNLLYVLLFIVILFLLIKYPSLFPHYQDIFVFDTMVLNVLLWLTVSFTLVLIHEMGHVLAMRAYNLPTKLEVGHRLFLVVLETDMSGVWKLTPKERNLLFLAGLCFDTLFLFIALSLQLIFPNGSMLVIGLMNFIVFDIVLRMIYQCCFYLKTDLYFLFENVTGCYNLYENAQHRIRKRLSFLKTNIRNEVTFTGEERIVFIYSVFYIIGIMISIAVFFIYFIPEVIFAGKQVLPGFMRPPTSLVFWDAVLFTLQVGIFVLLLIYSWSKKYLRT